MSRIGNVGFYAILTAPRCGYERLTRLVVQYGVSVVQLRMKDRPLDEVRDIGVMMREVTAGSRTRLIVNDFPEIAAEVGADGVHVGQDDMPLEQARRIVGPDAVIGVSTHNPAQTATACAARPDYIGVGPVFATPTKKIPDPPIGIEGMQAMLAIATVPAVVLGSITVENLPHILAAGARSFSLVRPLNNTPDPEPVLREILRVSGECVGGKG